MKVNGSCLCKSVIFSFDVSKKHFEACHCSMCRSWGGGPALTVVADGNIQFSGEEFISIYQSSEWAERGFCKKCGSNLFYRLSDKSQNFCNFNLGVLEGSEKYKFVTEIFIDSKPENYSFSNETKKMTEKEVIEAFGEL